MAQVILDLGSGNSCRNSIDYAFKMIDAVASIDSHKHEVIFKWQLFQDEPPNVSLDHLVFGRAYAHAKGLGYKTTSSVFDKKSLEFLLNYDVPFVKIACRPRIYWLTGLVPRSIPIYISISGADYPENLMLKDRSLLCVARYPAKQTDYEQIFGGDDLAKGMVSDHTVGIGMYQEYQPIIWEKHFVLEDDPANPDAALGHAIKPDLLKEVIGA